MLLNRKKYKYRLLFPALLAIGLGFGFESRLADRLFNGLIYTHFRKEIYHKEKLLDQVMNDVADRARATGGDVHKLLSDKEYNVLKDNQISILLYDNDSLIYWSDNTIAAEKPDHKYTYKPGLFPLGNGWYILRDNQSDKFTIRGLILIRQQYQYENKYLKTRFFKGSWLGHGYSLSTVPVENGIPVTGSDGGFLFSLVQTERANGLMLLRVLSFLFYLSGLIFFFLLAVSYTRRYPSKVRFLLPVLFFLLAGLNFCMIYWHIPRSVYSLPLFSPYYFAISDWIPSVGDLFLSAVFIFFFIYLCWISFPAEKQFGNKAVKIISVFAGFLLSGLFFSGIVELLYQLIMNSSLSLEPYKVLNIKIYSVIGFLSVGLLFMAFILFTDRVILMSRSLTRKLLFVLVSGSLVNFLFSLYVLNFHLRIIVIIIYILLLIALWVKRKSLYMSLVLISLITGLFATWFVLYYSFEKEKNNMKVIAVNLGAEHDPVAELMMSELSCSLQNDPELKFVMSKPSFTNRNVDNIFQYLTMRYFKGYWNKYDLSVYLCTPHTGLFTNEAEEKPCFAFFRNLIRETGTPIRDTKFYYLDNQNGQISYFGAFFYPSGFPGDSNGLYIQLDSKLLYEQLGYPELLLNKATSREIKTEQYSYAKYYNGRLVAQNGDYQYSLSDKLLLRDTAVFTFVTINNYNHIVYHEDTPVTVILSFPVRRFNDYLISFSYFFIFFFLLFLVGFSRTVFPTAIHLRPKLLKQKFQVWMISLLLFTLLLIGSGSVLYSIRQYQTNHFKNLTEKILSVYVEMEHKLSFEHKLDKSWTSPQYASLNDLLVKFSNVFYSDINLYDSTGLLLATSRPEIFEKKLTGKRMNEKAFYQLSILKQSEFIQKESLGDLHYLSAYMPFLNNKRHLLAYLNLPYFTKQYVLTREITNMIVGIINYMVVLILISIILAVIISDKITDPLRAIQGKIGKFQLGKEYEHIAYTGSDEIGSLVDAYNRMIDELARNVELLAKSERETAWREMAKQIAHEIKNPLTPMKLSVQQLQRAWENNKENFDIQFGKLTKTLIGQIDRLSDIATAFSNFARLPRMKNEPVNLIKLVQDTVFLFRAQHKIVFDLHLPERKDIEVFADKELLRSVFTNLLKNAVQSVKNVNEGNIEVSFQLVEEDNRVRVFVRDNGTGIPPGLEDKLFEPNFTTKTSGMGMGLAIVKKVVEDTKGRVWFEPTPGKGATFVVEMPVYQSARE